MLCRGQGKGVFCEALHASCGEGAAQPALAEAYARLGVRAFSLPARELLEVKEYLMGVTL